MRHAVTDRAAGRDGPATEQVVEAADARDDEGAAFERGPPGNERPFALKSFCPLSMEARISSFLPPVRLAQLLNSSNTLTPGVNTPTGV